MGISGLTSYIDQHRDILRHHKLRDTKVIIDGNNFYHYLYSDLGIAYRYGGDYHKFSKGVKRVFGALKKCNISPYVVFDGAYDTDNKKLPVIIRRAKDRIRHASNIVVTGHGTLLPILTLHTLLSVLKELDIPFVMCTFEADDQIAALANAWDCPVMSNDSDFFVYNLRGGMLPLDYITFSSFIDQDLSLGGNQFLPCMYYHRNNFLKFHKLTNDLALPLLAVIMGNDFVPVDSIQRSMLGIHQPQGKSHFPGNKVRNIVQWLDSVEHFDVVIEKLKSSIQDDRTKAAVDYCLNGYSNPSWDDDFSLKLYLEKGSEYLEDLGSRHCDFNGDKLPVWFLHSLHRAELSPHIINAAILHRTFLLAQLEDVTKPSAYDVSLPIRKVYYAIATNYSHKEASTKKQFHIEEYCRKDINLKKNAVSPSYNFSQQFLSCDLHLSIIPEITLRERQYIMFRALHPDGEFISIFSCGIKLLVMVIIYWLNNSTPAANHYHLQSLLISILYLQMKELDPDYGKNGDACCHGDDIRKLSSQSEFQKAISCSSEKQLTMFKKNIDKYSRQNTGKVVTDVKILHAFSQFQAILFDIIQLNQILCSPFELDPRRLFHGTLLHNLCRDLPHRQNITLFLKEMLVKDSPLELLYQKLYSEIVSQCDTKCSSEASADRYKHGGKKSRKSKSASLKDVRHDSVGDHANRSDGNDANCYSDRRKEEVVIAQCATNNKFALLNIND